MLNKLGINEGDAERVIGHFPNDTQITLKEALLDIESPTSLSARQITVSEEESRRGQREVNRRDSLRGATVEGLRNQQDHSASNGEST